MATFLEIAEAAPAVAAVASTLWPGIHALDAGRGPVGGSAFAVAYLATVRPDGGPRLHPFCPILAGGRLFAAIPLSSPKGDDLRRDPRCVLHAMPGPEDDELCIRASAHEVTDATTKQVLIEVVTRSGVGGMIETVTHDPTFEFDIERVEVARWLDIGQPGTRAERLRWVAPA